MNLEGRVIAGLLMIIGVGQFGVFTGLFASWFVRPHSSAEPHRLQQPESGISLLSRELANLSSSLTPAAEEQEDSHA